MKESQTTPDDALLHQAEEAVLYAYPVYEMCRMRALTSPQRLPGGEALAPPQRWCNRFMHARRLMRPGQSRVPTPNHDTLYSTAWLDLADGAWVLDMPDMAGRYHVMGLLDMFTNPFAHLGQRLTGNQARSFLITGPGWRGEVPAAFRGRHEHVISPTRWVWLLGRMLVEEDERDLPAAHALQNAIRLSSLPDWEAGRPSEATAFDPECDPNAALDATLFATQVNRALRDDPPPEDDAWLKAALASAGLGPGWPVPEGEQLALLQKGLDQAVTRLRTLENGRRTMTGWLQMPLIGNTFAQDYEFRALVALKYIGMLESREATYSLALNDSQGRPLTGSHRYRMRFKPGTLPRVYAFWSLTLYSNADGMLVPNVLHRHAIGDRTPGLQYDADGGLTLTLSHQPPQDQFDMPSARANWLPAPADGFYLCLRFYLPSDAVLESRTPLPPLQREEGIVAG